MDYPQIISKISKNNYKFYLNNTKSFFNSYYKNRIFFLNKLKKETGKSNLKKKTNTLKKLFNLNKNSKKYLKTSINNLYKKIEIFQKIYSDYNKYFYSKKNNVEAEIESYVIINKLILKSKYFNDLKKLNVSLKINDKVLLNYDKIKDRECLNILEQNIIKELRLIKKFNV